MIPEPSAIPSPQSTQVEDRGRVRRALELSIDVGLVILLAVACLWILRPFLPLLAWGIIVAVAGYPAYQTLQRYLGGRGGWAAALFALLLLAVLMLPAILLAGTLVDGVQALASHLKEGTLVVPPPPPNIETWPLIGVPLKNLWTAASTNLTHFLRSLAPQLKGLLPGLLSASAGIGLTVLEFILSILVAAGLLAYASNGARLARSFFNRLFGNQGPDYEALVGATIRSVTTGILGVALIQSVCAGLGFLLVGLPGAGLWAMLFLFAAVLQVGVLVLIPAVVYAFTIASTVKAAIFLVWCAIVGLMDNVLKPLLLGRGVSVPIAVVFLGAIGGFVAIGIIGLFVGAILLSVAYKLFLAWLQGPEASLQTPDAGTQES